MSSELTASILIRSRTAGAPSFTKGSSFRPTDAMVLMDGSRASWVVQQCPAFGRTRRASLIEPASPRFLLAAGVLGYVALTVPDALNRSERLRNAIAGTRFDDRRYANRLHTGHLDRDLATHVFTSCSEFIQGVVTIMPRSEITDSELRIASDSGLLVAVPDRAVEGEPSGKADR